MANLYFEIQKTTCDYAAFYKLEFVSVNAPLE